MNDEARKLLVFDLDGTLVDARPELLTAINHLRGSLSLAPIDRSELDQLLSHGAGSVLDRVIPDPLVLTTEDMEEFNRVYTEHSTDELHPYDGVTEGLQALYEAGYLLALNSNNVSAGCRAIVEKLGVAPLFTHVIGADDAPAPKPAPDTIDMLRRELDVSASNTWMIGDSGSDMQSADRAGVQAGFLRHGFGSHGSVTPHAAWDDFSQLVEFFVSAV